MKKRSACLIALSAALSVGVISTPQALAFGTIRGLGQNAEHERITRHGLLSFGFGPNSLGQLAGDKSQSGAVGAPDGSLDLVFTKAAHCDSGDFFPGAEYPQTQEDAQAMLTACRTFIYSNIKAAVSDAAGLVNGNLEVSGFNTSLLGGCVFNGAKGRAKCNVFEDMGRAFHATQDFYSHSNWIDPRRETPTIEDPQGLDHRVPAAWLSPSGAAFPAGLVTGCFENIPEAIFCKGRIKHATLNKDTTVSLRGTTAYDRAMAVAAWDTRNKWTYFEKRLVATYGPARAKKMICALRSDNPGSC